MNKKLVIEIKSGTPAFGSDYAQRDVEVSRILRTIIARAEHGRQIEYLVLYDANGERVGQAWWEDEKLEPRPEWSLITDNPEEQ